MTVRGDGGGGGLLCLLTEGRGKYFITLAVRVREYRLKTVGGKYGEKNDIFTPKKERKKELSKRK